MRKKIKFLFVFAFLFLIPFVSKVNASQIVDVYLFRGEGCPHCAAAEEFFDKLEDDYSYSYKFVLNDYEVWYDDENAELMKEVAKKLNTTANGVPFIVIGDKYFSGYSSSMDESIKSAISNAYYSYSYKDVVSDVEDKLYDTRLDDAYNRLIDNLDLDDVTREEFRLFGKPLIGMFLVLFIISMILSFAIAAYEIIILWKVFKKAGKHGWEAIIPFYNIWVLFEISGYPGPYMFFMFIPIANIVFFILANISLAKKFKKEGAFHVLLWLIPIVGYSILAFGKDTYDPSLGEQRNSSNNGGGAAPSEESKNETSGNYCTNCGKKVTKSAKFCTHCGKELG